jgi:hypothetical protein
LAILFLRVEWKASGGIRQPGILQDAEMFWH